MDPSPQPSAPTWHSAPHQRPHICSASPTLSVLRAKARLIFLLSLFSLKQNENKTKIKTLLMSVVLNMTGMEPSGHLLRAMDRCQDGLHIHKTLGRVLGFHACPEGWGARGNHLRVTLSCRLGIKDKLGESSPSSGFIPRLASLFKPHLEPSPTGTWPTHCPPSGPILMAWQ